MKKFISLFFGFFIILAQSTCCLADTLSPDIQSSLKGATGGTANGFSVVFSLVFVLLLIYVTGIIYQKLNVLGAKTAKEQFKKNALHKAVVLSTTQIGQGRNLHVVELNGKHYLIGSAQNSINLLKELENEEMQELTKETKISDKEEIDNAIKILYDNPENKFEEITSNSDSDKKSDNGSDIYKKYL